MNKLYIIGNLTHNPESRTTNDGKNVCTFTVAVNRRKKDTDGKNIADFFRVSAWGVTGENCQKYLEKGKKVAVVGQVSVHAYAGQDGTPKASMEVFAEDVEFLSPVGSSGQGSTAQEQAQAPEGFTPVEIADDQLPF